MERAPLRPVPSRPPGPIAPAEAFRYVTRELPGLDGRAAGALAMVALVGLPRKEIGTLADPAEVAGLSGEALAEALTRGRKALRRRLYPLPGSGWCERAERLISDRLDDALEDPGPRRLEVHLANCGRCIEHERRLAQSQESLVAGFIEAHSPAESEPDSAPPAGDAEAQVEADSSAVPPVLRAVDAPILSATPEPETLPSPDSSQDALPPGAAPEPAQLEGESGEPAAQPAQLEGESGEPAAQPAQLEEPPAERQEEPIRLGPAQAASEEPPAEEELARAQEPPAGAEEPHTEEKPPRLEEPPAAPAKQSPAHTEQPPPPREERPAAAVPSARRRSSTTLWTPSAPSPPRMPPAADPPPRAALTPSPPLAGAPPPPLPVAPPAPTPLAPASHAPAAAAMPSGRPSDAPPEPPSPAPWASDPPRPRGPALSSPAATPNAWRSDAPRPSLAAHRSLESEDVWTAIGPLVAVLSVAVVIAVIAGMLALGG